MCFDKEGNLVINMEEPKTVTVSSLRTARLTLPSSFKTILKSIIILFSCIGRPGCYTLYITENADKYAIHAKSGYFKWLSIRFLHFIIY